MEPQNSTPKASLDVKITFSYIGVILNRFLVKVELLNNNVIVELARIRERGIQRNEGDKNYCFIMITRYNNITTAN